MRKILFSYLAILFSLNGISQTGTSIDPFTSFAQANTVVVPGFYFFDIAGVGQFDTRVEPGGWILIATSSGLQAAGPHILSPNQHITSLGSDLILPAAIYTTVTPNSAVSSVRISSNSGPNTPFNVSTTSATVISNLRANTTLSFGLPGFDVTMWTGTGVGFMLIKDEVAVSTVATTLDLNTYHAGGNTDGLHWRLGFDDERIEWDQTGGGNPLNLWVNTSIISLPVGLISFEATVIDKRVKIDWSTSSETNNDFFSIQKSLDGITWVPFATVKSAGNSSLRKDYSIYDNSPVSGKQFYRLKQTDLNGAYKFSDIRSATIKSDGKGKILLYPNPTVADNFTIRVDAPSISNSSIKVYDLSGRILIETRLTSTSMPVDVSKLSRGYYVVQVNLEGVKQSFSIIKN